MDHYDNFMSKIMSPGLLPQSHKVLKASRNDGSLTIRMFYIEHPAYLRVLSYMKTYIFPSVNSVVLIQHPQIENGALRKNQLLYM